jgi:F420-dependent oxidoreductase-like protein
MLISAKLAPVFPYEELETFWRAADECGFHAVWNYDHFYGIGGGLTGVEQDTLEGWTTLAAMATIVKRARIGCMVTGITYRHPAVLANMAVTVDHISGGRLDFGIGAAWHEDEHRAYGIPFPSALERVEMLEESVQLIKALWTDERTTFEGKHYRITDALCNPKPLQRHPPIVIGGTRPKIMRVIARHADEWNGIAFDIDVWRESSARLDEACVEVGRDPSTLRRGAQLFLIPGQEEQVKAQIDQLPAYEDAGCEHAVLSFYQPPSHALLEQVAPR